MPTKIEWAEETWNPVTGCTPISEGCQNCYAKRMASRLAGRFGYDQDDPFKVTFHEDKLHEPEGWHMPRKIFVSSMGDLFHDDAPFDFIDRMLMEIIYKCRWHTFMMLTKRPERMKEYFNAVAVRHSTPDWFPNLWLGVTAENQRAADERIPILLQIPAAVRFVSVEPMLGSVDLQQAGAVEIEPDEKPDENVLGYAFGRICWVICGAETGARAREMDPNWARNLRDQCDAAQIPFFMKAMSKKAPIPEDLNRKEWPK